MTICSVPDIASVANRAVPAIVAAIDRRPPAPFVRRALSSDMTRRVERALGELSGRIAVVIGGGGWIGAAADGFAREGESEASLDSLFDWVRGARNGERMAVNRAAFCARLIWPGVQPKASPNGRTNRLAIVAVTEPHRPIPPR